MKTATGLLFPKSRRPREKEGKALSSCNEVDNRRLRFDRVNSRPQHAPSVANSPISSPCSYSASPFSSSSCSSSYSTYGPSQGTPSVSPSTPLVSFLPSCPGSSYLAEPADAVSPTVESPSAESSPSSPLSSSSACSFFTSSAAASAPSAQAERLKTQASPTVRRGVAYRTFSQNFYAGQGQADDIVIPLHVTKAVFGTSLRRKKGWVTWYDSRTHRLSSTSMGQWVAESRALFLLSLREGHREGEARLGGVMGTELRGKWTSSRGQSRPQRKKSHQSTRAEGCIVVGEQEKEKSEDRCPREGEAVPRERLERREGGEQQERDCARARAGEAEAQNNEERGWGVRPTGLEETSMTGGNREGGEGRGGQGGDPGVNLSKQSVLETELADEKFRSRHGKEVREARGTSSPQQRGRASCGCNSAALSSTPVSPRFASSPVCLSCLSASTFSCTSAKSHSSVSLEDVSNMSTSPSCPVTGGGSSACMSSSPSCSPLSSASPSSAPASAVGSLWWNSRRLSSFCEGKRPLRRTLYVFLFLHGLSPPGVDSDVTENWGNLIAALLEKFPEKELRERRGEEPFVLTWAFTYRRATFRGIRACMEALLPAMTNELGALLPFFDALHLTAVGHSLGGLVWRFLLDRKLKDLPLFLPTRRRASQRNPKQPNREAENDSSPEKGTAGGSRLSGARRPVEAWGEEPGVEKKRSGLRLLLKRRRKTSKFFEGSGRTGAGEKEKEGEKQTRGSSMFPFSLSRLYSSPSNSFLDSLDSPFRACSLASTASAAGQRGAGPVHLSKVEAERHDCPSDPEVSPGTGSLRREVLELFDKILNSPKVLLDVFCTLASPHVGTYKSKPFVRAVPKALSFMSCLPASEIAKEILNTDEQQLIRCLVEHEKAECSWLPFQSVGDRNRNAELGENARGEGGQAERSECESRREQQSILRACGNDEGGQRGSAGGEAGQERRGKDAREEMSKRTVLALNTRDGSVRSEPRCSSRVAPFCHAGRPSSLLCPPFLVPRPNSFASTASQPTSGSSETGVFPRRPSTQKFAPLSSDPESDNWTPLPALLSSCGGSSTALLLGSPAGAKKSQRLADTPRKAFQSVLFYGVLDTDWLVSVNSALGTCIDLKLTEVGQEAFRHPMRPIEFSLDKDREVYLEGRTWGANDKNEKADETGGKGRHGEKSDCRFRDKPRRSSAKKTEKEISLAAEQVEVLQSLKHLRRFVVYIPQNPVTTAAHATIKCSPNYVTQETQRSMRKQANEILQHITAGLLTGATTAVIGHGDAEPGGNKA
ncbi:hypothetical protein TGRUB_205200 [Toxoplasma gondii RUB]|uniref:Serine esterase (DUF676) protein n=1 Tax=Toxoplasma gondii RUB TaxID=935652 RepID=A0A086LR95_TOXGO|nr:hypothetical protein TGRUB_205200 [Toxoplasma gondii RUB]